MKNLADIHTNGPVSIVAIGAGNRTNKYLEYVKQHPDKVKLVGVVELNDIRRHKVAERFGLDASCCYSDYREFFNQPKQADAVMVCTPENMHFEPTMLAVEAGYHVLLEKPIAQTLDECLAIGEAARKKGVLVSVCHVLRYHPYFMKIKELVDSGELGHIISINHRTSVGVDRAAHGFVRGIWRSERLSNPMLMSKCCHDIDFLLWLTKTPCRKLTSFGSLRWFKAKNAPEGLLMSVGGNVRATGPKDEQGSPWIVGGQDPRNPSAHVHTLYLSGGSLVTSGDYQRTYTVDGKQYHHIIDPNTLYPSEYWRSVSVVCEDSGLADALSKSLFLLPQEDGQRLLEKSGAEAMWVAADGNQFYSPGFQALIRT